MMTRLRAITLQLNQRVRVTEAALAHVNESFRGKVGTVVYIYPLTMEFPISVIFDGLPDVRSFQEDELEAVDE